MNKEQLQEATIHKLLEAQHENSELENKLEQIWQELTTKLENLGFTYKPRSDWKEYKHLGDFVTEPIEIKNGVTRHVEVDAFFALPSFPTWYYYLGAQINKVEVSTNTENRYGLKTDGYEVKEEVRQAHLSFSGETDEIVCKGNTVDEFIAIVKKVVSEIGSDKFKSDTMIIDDNI